MAQLPDAVGCIRLTFTFSQGANKRIMNRTFYHYAGTAPNIAELQQFVASAHSTYTSNVLPHMNEFLYLESVKGVDLSTPTAPEYEYALNKQGGSVGSAAAPGESIMINFHVNRRYRGGHPRWYQAGLDAQYIDQSGSLQAAFVSTFKGAFDTFLNNVASVAWSGAGQIQHVNVSYYKGFTNHTKPSGRVVQLPTPRATPTVDVIVGTSINPQVTSQRRRNLVP
jgi:hypothetical protein